MAPLLLPRAGAAYDPEPSPSRARARADGEEPPRGRPAGSCTRSRPSCWTRARAQAPDWHSRTFALPRSTARMATPAPCFTARREWPTTFCLALTACPWSVPHRYRYGLLVFLRRQIATPPLSRVGTAIVPPAMPMQRSVPAR